MKIAILSRNPKAYSTRRLCESATGRGHQVEVLNTLELGIHVEQAQPSLTHRTHPCEPFQAVIPRIGASITFFGTAVVRQFEQMGVFPLNSSQAIAVARDKLRCLQILSRHDIGIPPSAFVRSKNDVLPAIERVGGTPVIIKLLEGTQGIGVILAEDIKTAEAIIETLQSTKQNVLIQKFVSESKGRDIRAFVVGDRVVCAMRRQAAGQEFRSNVHRGGSVQAVQLDEIYERTAVRAAQIIGLQVAGVDMLEGKDGPQIMEVNSSPGLQGIEKATKMDVAGAIIEHLEDQVIFEEIDIRQRLTLARGFQIAEITVGNDSEIANKTLVDTGLRARDILVLSIHRNTLIIPNPKGDFEVLPGDLLLCYGKQIAMKSFLLAGAQQDEPRLRQG